MNQSIPVVYVHYKCKDKLFVSLTSLKESLLKPFVLIVDHSGDLDDEAIESYRAFFPELKLLLNHENPGFGAGVNHGLRAHGDWRYACVANPDVQFTPHTLSTLVEFMETHERCGMVGPKILTRTGDIEFSWGPDPGFFTEILMKLRSRLETNQFLQKRAHRKCLSPFRVRWITGACFLIRREAWEAVQGFDERFFLYYEDCDLARRIRGHGWDIWVEPRTSVVHNRGSSVRKLPELRLRLHRRQSQILYYKKHCSRFDQFLLETYLRLIREHPEIQT